MPTRRVLRSVLCNFLGTYTSRYSDYDGYWLLGLLAREVEQAEFDLLARDPRGRDPITQARWLAAVEFRDQATKAGLDESRIADARLHLERLSADTGIYTGTAREGWNYRLIATATTDTGRRFECSATVFAAPHDPKLESRSARPRRFERPAVRGRLHS